MLLAFIATNYKFSSCWLKRKSDYRVNEKHSAEYKRHILQTWHLYAGLPALPLDAGDVTLPPELTARGGNWKEQQI